MLSDSQLVEWRELATRLAGPPEVQTWATIVQAFPALLDEVGELRQELAARAEASNRAEANRGGRGVSIQCCPVCQGKMVQDITVSRDTPIRSWPAGTHCSKCGTRNEFNRHQYDNRACPNCGAYLLYPADAATELSTRLGPHDWQYHSGVMVCFCCHRRFQVVRREVEGEMYSDDGPSNPSYYTYIREGLEPMRDAALKQRRRER